MFHHVWALHVSTTVCAARLCLISTIQFCLLQDLEKIIILLLNKSAETNKLLKEDANNALDAMVEATLPSKAIPILIQEGLQYVWRDGRRMRDRRQNGSPGMNKITWR